MVNFKGGGHQGEHKRALAAQGGDQSAAVSKLEKLALRKDDAQKMVVNEGGIALHVVAREKRLTETNTLLKAVLVDGAALAHFQARAAGRTNAMGAPLLCRPGSDFVLSAVAHEAAGPGEILLSEAQRLTLHVCEDDWYEWSPFAAEAEPLAELVLEAQLLEPTPGGEAVVVESEALARAAAKWLFGEVISTNEIFMATYEVEPAGGGDEEKAAAAAAAARGGVRLVLRVTDLAHPPPEEEEEEELSVSGPHCFRGVLAPGQTRVFACPSTNYKSSALQLRLAQQLQLVGVPARPARPARAVVHVTTSDGECFPCPKRLLQPCIALTKAVRDRAAEVEARVEVDCSTFDRVLLYLEAAARGQAGSFAFDANSLEDVAQAASALGCRPLSERVAALLGDFKSRVRMHRWAEVVARNEAGGCWVSMDGMIFDLEAWLPEHPGGATIIPQQALNKDCTVFFELYHASRESFTYLREFYIGELWPEERALVPMEEETASADFMAQLRAFSAGFRLSEESQLAFVKAHLGT
eukprot:Transcript_7628.p1 GENE.Transcript_7628~~Transcript_7628.p1  ORF type:complete len:526 (+),score=279.49 Transcript_7628:151-1728(+)